MRLRFGVAPLAIACGSKVITFDSSASSTTLNESSSGPRGGGVALQAPPHPTSLSTLNSPCYPFSSVSCISQDPATHISMAESGTSVYHTCPRDVHGCQNICTSRKLPQLLHTVDCLYSCSTESSMTQTAAVFVEEAFH